MVNAPYPDPQQQPDEEEDTLFDFGQVRNLGGFVVHAVKRHRTLAIFTFLGIVALSVLTLFLVPKSFHTETKILAQRNLVMPALGNPKRAVPTDSDTPTKSAAETVLRRDNLIAIIKQTNLMDEWDQSRAPILKIKDFAAEAFSRGKRDEEERLEMLIGLLGKRLTVKAEEGTVTIGIDWPDANMAFRLVDAAQQNFLEARHAAEVSSIAETISILEGHAANVRESVENTLDELRKARGERVLPRNDKDKDKTASEQDALKPARREGAKASLATKELSQVRIMLTAKRRAISDLEEFRRKRLSELQGQLREQQTQYGPAHPVIANLKQSIQSLQAESPQVASLKREEQELAADYTRRGGKDADDADDDASMVAPLGSIRRAAVEHTKPSDDESELVAYGRTRLKIAIGNYEDLLDRIEGARIELDTARAAFKYRYSVVTPATVPKTADKPKPEAFVIGGLVLGLILAFFAVLAKDLGSGRIIEAWQIEKYLRLPLLGEVKTS